MYLTRTVLAPRSNREDFLEFLGLFDDDTGQPIKIDGCTTANGQAFTASAWTVTDGVIVTTSANTITIPAFPIGNQVSALALTAGTGLGILTAAPLTIKDTATAPNKILSFLTSYTSPHPPPAA